MHDSEPFVSVPLQRYGELLRKEQRLEILTQALAGNDPRYPKNPRAKEEPSGRKISPEYLFSI